MIQFYEKNEPADIERIAILAANIWREHYLPLIGSRQVEYMLQNFQSVDAITRQIENDGYRYFVAEEDGAFLGYCAFQKSDDSNRLFLSKFYMQKSWRGRGLGRKMLCHAVRSHDANPQTIVWLTVNKGNAGSIAAYEKMGFRIAGEIIADIGNGYVMDDFRLECPAEKFLQNV